MRTLLPFSTCSDAQGPEVAWLESARLLWLVALLFALVFTVAMLVPWVRLGFARHRWILDVAVVWGVAALAAIGGLVAEDVMPLPKEGSVPGSATWDRQRLTVAVLLLSAVALVVIYRWRLRAAFGTLYYVRLLTEWMADWHVARIRGHGGSQMQTRVVANNLLNTAVEGVVDAAATVESTRAQLSEAMNSDDSSTGFALAPNLMWPAAVGVGYGFYAREGMSLIEPRGTGRLRWRLDPPRRLRGGRVPSSRTQSAKTRTSDSHLVTVDLTPGGPTTPPPAFQPGHRTRIAVFKHTHGIDSATPSVIVSTRWLGWRVAVPDPKEARPSAPNPAMASAESASGKATGAASPDRAMTSAWPVHGQVRVHPQVATEAVVAELRAALHGSHDGRVYVILRVPNTVAFAIGYRLSGSGQLNRREGAVSGNSGVGVRWLRARPRRNHSERPQVACTDRACRYPWRRLVLLVRDQDTTLATPTYRIMRVNPGQPTVAQLAANARADGLVLSRSIEMTDEA